jgi:hypothetical protein
LAPLLWAAQFHRDAEETVAWIAEKEAELAAGAACPFRSELGPGCSN